MKTISFGTASKGESLWLTVPSDQHSFQSSVQIFEYILKILIKSGPVSFCWPTLKLCKNPKLDQNPPKDMSEPILEPILTLRLQFAGATDFFFHCNRKTPKPESTDFPKPKK